MRAHPILFRSFWMLTPTFLLCSLAGCDAGSSSDAHVDAGVLDAGVHADSGDGEDAGPVEPVEDPAELGPWAVGHATFVEVDASRGDRDLPIDVWYPVDAADAKTSPRARYSLLGTVGLDSEVAVTDLPVSSRQEQTLLVFSHGYQGIRVQSVKLMEALASHGFVIASVEHTGNSQASSDDDFDAAAANRVPDVSFVIDAMLERSGHKGDDFFGRLDSERVGVIGHSFGGMTAIGMACGWAGADVDPRVAAIVPISAVIDAEKQASERTSPNAGFSAAQLGRIAIPVMLIGGTADESVPIENNELAFERLDSAPALYRVDIKGANHTHFAGVCDIGNLLLDIGFRQSSWPGLGAEDLVEPYEATCGEDAFPIEEATRLTNLFAVAFFGRHLRGERGYAEFLDKAFASTEDNVRLWSR